MSDPIEDFVKQAPPIDTVRDEAARCAEETARWQRGERGPLRMPVGLISGEFSDAAFGVAAEVSMIVAKSMLAAGYGFSIDFPWSTAAHMLRNGWRREDRLKTMEVKGDRS